MSDQRRRTCSRLAFVTPSLSDVFDRPVLKRVRFSMMRTSDRIGTGRSNRLREPRWTSNHKSQASVGSLRQLIGTSGYSPVSVRSSIPSHRGRVQRVSALIGGPSANPRVVRTGVCDPGSMSPSRKHFGDDPPISTLVRCRTHSKRPNSGISAHWLCRLGSRLTSPRLHVAYSAGLQGAQNNVPLGCSIA